MSELPDITIEGPDIDTEMYLTIKVRLKYIDHAWMAFGAGVASVGCCPQEAYSLLYQALSNGGEES